MIHTNTDSSASGLGNRTHSRFELIVDYLGDAIRAIAYTEGERCAGDVLEKLAFRFSGTRVKRPPFVGERSQHH